MTKGELKSRLQTRFEQDEAAEIGPRRQEASAFAEICTTLRRNREIPREAFARLVSAIAT